MSDMNTVLIEGRLSKNPVRLANSTCELTITSKTEYDNGRQVDSMELPLVLSGNVAETCMNILRKGNGIRAVGKLRIFTLMHDGVTEQKTQLMVEHIEFTPNYKEAR